VWQEVHKGAVTEKRRFAGAGVEEKRFCIAVTAADNEP